MINTNRFIAPAILGTLLVLACIKPGMAQTQESAAAQTSGTPNDSAAAIKPSASVIVRTAGLEEYLRKPQSATRQLLQLDQKSACGVEIAVVWNSLNLFVTHLTLNARSTRFRGDYAPKQIDTEPDVNNEVRVINIGGIPRYNE